MLIDNFGFTFTPLQVHVLVHGHLIAGSRLGSPSGSRLPRNRFTFGFTFTPLKVHVLVHV